MRPVGMTLAAVLLVALAAQAQPPAVAPPGPAVPGAPPAAPPADPKLEGHLTGWEQKMSGVVNFHTKFELTRTEAIFKKDLKYDGSVLCMKPNLARLRIVNTTDKNDYEAYICNGKAIYQYEGSKKTITEFKLNAAQPAAGSDNLMLDFLSGMKAADAKRRFQISLFKEDPNYVYLDIKPILPKDQQEFQQVRFALYGPGVKSPAIPYLPAQMWLLKPNGDTELWKFGDQRIDLPGVTPQVFQFEEIKGWQLRQPQPPVGPGPAVPPGLGAPPTLPGGTGLPAGPGAVKR
ncbi:MAG: hypothetical protein JWO38_6025 [Gemmataceae bacterium]|nr:hypothetical protein [Gemmataceae bacterium]